MVEMLKIVQKMIANRLIFTFRKIIFSLVLLNFVSCQNDPLLIVSGVGVNNYRIGNKLSDMNYSEQDLSFILSKTDSIIVSIDVFNTKYYTSKGIKVGDTYTEVKEQYGKPNEKPVLLKGDKHSYRNPINKKYPFSLRYKGITFFIDAETGTVSKIRIYNYKYSNIF